MFDRFTERAANIMHLARKEAQGLNHEYISTEHILLGIVKGPNGGAHNVLSELEVSSEEMKADLERTVQKDSSKVIFGQLPFTLQSKKVFERAYEYSVNELKNNYIGTEHLLYGLIQEPDGITGQVFFKYDLREDNVDKAVRKLSSQ